MSNDVMEMNGRDECRSFRNELRKFDKQDAAVLQRLAQASCDSSASGWG